jgi:NAD(P)-dependent dehydrogenase (short-subunit alcohol dehydrogenase family)
MQIPEDWQAGSDHLKNRIILITGAGSGIGAAVAKACARQGATVILLDRIVRDLERVYDAIEAAGGPQAAIYPLNLEGAAEKDYADLATALQEEFGRLDGLLHNAALLGALTPIAHFEAELWIKVLQVNLNGPFLLTRACLPLLMSSPDAAVLFNSDRVGRRGKAYWGAYSISKAASENFMQVLSDELEANTAIRVNSLDPGPTATALRALAYPAEDPGRLAQPEDTVRPFLYLLGPDSKGVTGAQFES